MSQIFIFFPFLLFQGRKENALPKINYALRCIQTQRKNGKKGKGGRKMEFCALRLGCVALHFGSKNVKNNATIYI